MCVKTLALLITTNRSLRVNLKKGEVDHLPFLFTHKFSGINSNTRDFGVVSSCGDLGFSKLLGY